MAAVVKRIRVVNPRRKKRTRPRRRAKNGVLTLGALNPRRKTTMKKKRSKTRKVNSSTKQRRRRNPFLAKKRSHRRRHRNPGTVGSYANRSLDTLKAGAAALGGLIAARQLPQLVLGEKNQGWIGYAANMITTLLVGASAERIFGREVAKHMLIGGGLATVERMIRERMTPLGRALSMSGVGDALAHGTTARSLRGNGPAYFTSPAISRNGRPVVPTAITDAATAAAAARAGSRMSGLRLAMR